MSVQLDVEGITQIPGYDSLSIYLQQQIKQYMIAQFDHLQSTIIIPLNDQVNACQAMENEYNNVISQLREENNTLLTDLQSTKLKSNQYKSDSINQISSLKNDNITLTNKFNITVNDLTHCKEEIKDLNQLKQSHFKQLQVLQNVIDTNELNYEKDLILQENLNKTQHNQLLLCQSQLNKIKEGKNLLVENERLQNLIRSNDKITFLNNLIQDLENKLSIETQSKHNLQSKFESYINELESKLPLVESYKSKIDDLTIDLSDSKNIIILKEQEINELKQSNLDLSHQLQYFLITLNLQSNSNQKLLSNKQLIFLQNLISENNNSRNVTTANDIITNELVEFNDIITLQELNEKLLKIVRSLSNKLELTESQNKLNNENNLIIINDAKIALETLQTYTTDLETKIDDLTTELNSFKDKTDHSTPPDSSSLSLDEELQKIKSLQDKINDLTIINNELLLKHEHSSSTNELYKKRIEMIESLLSNEKDLNQQYQLRINNLNDSIKEKDEEIKQVNEKLFNCDKELTKLTYDLKIQNIKLHKSDIELNDIRGRDEQNSQIIKSKDSKLNSLNDKIYENQFEINYLNCQISALQTVNNELNELTQKKNLSISNQLDNNSMDLKWYKNKIDLLMIEKTKLLKFITSQNGKIQLLTHTITSLKTKINNIESKHEMNERSMREENLNWNQQLSNHKQQLSSNTIELKALKESKTKNETLITDLQSQLSNIKNDYDEKILSLNNDLLERKQSLQNLQSINDNLTHTQRSLEQTNKVLNLKMEKLVKSDQENMKTIESNQLEILSLKNQIQSSEQIIQDNKLKLSELQTDLKTNNQPIEYNNNLPDLEKVIEEKETIWNQLINSQHEEVLLRNTLAEIRQQLTLVTTELDTLKQQTQTREGSPDLFDSSTEISDLVSQVEEYKNKNVDAEDRFNRLKKQAHEKLKQSKDTVNSLTIENDGFKILNQQLAHSLKLSEEKIKELESVGQDREQDKTTILSLQKELSTVLDKSKDIEDKLNENIKNSNDMIQELNKEIDELNNELNLLKHDGPNKLDDLSETVESMKKTFEDEKIQFISRTRKEFEEKLSQEKNSLEKSSSPDKSVNSQQFEKIKKELEDKFAKETETKLEAMRIENKNKLEQLRKEEEAKFEQLRKEDEEEIQKVKNKAFEEGKQQASMKTTLLERKISKLESQLKDAPPSKETSGTPSNPFQAVKTPDTVPVGKSSPFGSGTSTNNKLTFPFQSSTASINPFTSPLDKNVFMTSSNNASTLKPTFSLQLSNRTASDIDTSEMTRDSSSDESNVSSLKRSATEELSGNFIGKRIKEDDSKDDTPNYKSGGSF